MARISANQNAEAAKLMKDLPLLTPNSPNQHGYKNAIKAISLDTAHGLARMSDVAMERLHFHVNSGQKWAIELYFKIFTQLFDKSWLSSYRSIRYTA